MKKDTDGVEIKVWVKRGTMLVNTSALEITDPDHIYNQIKAQGKNPEDYDIKHPHEEEFEEKSRRDLISEILDLRREITGRALHGF